MALQSEELPTLELPDNAGTLKVIVGEYAGKTSGIPVYARQYLFHIRINAGSEFVFQSEKDLEYAAFLPQQELIVNGTNCHSGDLVGFEPDGGEMVFANNLEVPADVILFGGEKYTEPFFAYGPYVMSSRSEINQAHSDYMNGKYGRITYN